MRLQLVFLITLLCPIFLNAQTVVSQRVANLIPANYSIQGQAFLDKLDDGSLQLRLSEDFTTQRGPDVRVYLGNELSLNGAVEIVDLTDINHFSGALTLDVPAGIELEQYRYVVFYCVAFRALWASGELGEVMVLGEEVSCPASEVQVVGNTNICASDDQADLLSFSNTLNIGTDSNYVYLLTDENDMLQQVISQGFFDFEGSGEQTQRVYGLHYNGALNAPIGANVSQASASECHTLSNNFITITKSGCVQTYECRENATATTNWVTEVTICPEDGADDLIALKNNLFIAPGTNYAYLLTDANEVLQAVILDSVYNFEGTELEEQRVYGINYDGTLNPMIGQHRTQTTADGDCFTHSSSDLFLSIKKTACEPDFMCEETATATTNWVTEVTICPEDEVDDMVPLKNNLFVAPGEHYAYLLTDTNEILQAVILDTIYNFEGSGLEEQRVYGIHFDGMLNPMIGQPRTQTTANGDCFTHSSSDLFLSIKKTACEPDFVCEESATATTNWVTEVTICPEDGADDMIPLKNNLFLTPGDHYAYLLTDTNEILQAVVWDTIYNFEGSGLEEQRIYGVHFERTLMAFIGQHRNQTIADGCHQHSSSDLFLSIKKDACPAYECQESLTATHNWVTEVDICSNDGLTDAVFLQNNLFIPPGTNYTFLLTDANEILQAVVTDTTYNFEGTGEAEQRIYGLNFAGELLPKIGEHRRNTTATECFIHSGDNLFIRINKTAACVTNTFDEALASQVRLFPNPVQDLLNVELPTGFHPERIEVFDLFGSQKLTLPVSNSNIQEINVSQFSAGTYWLRMSNTEHFVTKRIIVTK